LRRIALREGSCEKKPQSLSLPLVAGLSFYLGANLTLSTGQGPGKIAMAPPRR